MPDGPDVFLPLELLELLLALGGAVVDVEGFGEVAIFEVAEAVLALAVLEADSIHEPVFEHPLVSHCIFQLAAHPRKLVVDVQPVAHQLLVFIQYKAEAGGVGLLVEVQEGVAIVERFHLEVGVGLTEFLLQVVEEPPGRVFDPQLVK